MQQKVDGKGDLRTYYRFEFVPPTINSLGNRKWKDYMFKVSEHNPCLNNCLTINAEIGDTLREPD